ncbi:ATP-binding protein [Ferrimicrobium sp.]|uniref:AAA family ATPase n=1 Tax=Ferrimicrobium sp. TaxID=2926050 RepID=UPI00262E337A|nr:ATP-binding protein [Ferrimicrobium sp.]
MATAEEVRALVRSHADGDDAHFYSVAMQVAAKAARGGQTKFASELRDLIDDAKRVSNREISRPLRPIPVVQPRGDLAGLLSVSYPDLHLNDVVFDHEARNGLEQVIIEQRQRDRLAELGFTPLHSLLLVGPPGTGKTLSAGVLATELNLPLFLIRLEVLITKYMGETASKLRLIFDAIAETRGVYLFDEVDALAGDRADSNDVGEIRRVLSSFLQFLENSDSTSVIIATTNHPQLLDRALFRRFGSVLTYPLPSLEVAQDVIRNRLAIIGTDEIEWRALDAVLTGLSHAELTSASEQAAKRAILSGNRGVTTELLVDALTERHQSSLQ